MRHVRAITALLLGLFLFQAAHAAISLAVPLAMAGDGLGALSIGLTAAAYSLGFLGGIIVLPRILQRVGYIRAFAILSAVASLTALAFPLASFLPYWLLLRFLAGACIAGLYTTAEGWLAETSERHERGKVLALGVVTGKIGLVLGPFALGGIEPGALAAFAVGAGLFTLALIPVALTRTVEPLPPQSEIFQPQFVWHAAPAAAWSGLVGGIANSSVFHMGPIYTEAFDPANPALAAAQFSAAVLIGGALSQLPAGSLSDRRDRREVMALLTMLSAVASLVLVLVVLTSTAFSVALIAGLAWGAGAGSLYAISVAHAIDRAEHESAAVVMAGVLFTWAIGATIGPMLAGLLMSLGLGAAGLFLLSTVVLALLTFWLLHRRGVQPAAVRGEKAAFEAAQASSLAAVEIDPRTDADSEWGVDEQEGDLLPVGFPVQDYAPTPSPIAPDEAKVGLPISRRLRFAQRRTAKRRWQARARALRGRARRV